MKRYDNIQTIVRWDGKRVYKSVNYPVITQQLTDVLVISNESDYLDTLAYKYYGDPTLWFIIALANPGIGRGRLSIPIGTTLRIPVDVNGIINEFNRLNSR